MVYSFDVMKLEKQKTRDTIPAYGEFVSET